MAAKKRWFDVTIAESYHATYKVKATCPDEADDLANEAVNSGRIEPANDGDASYDREVSVEEGDKPVKGDMIIEEEDD